MTLAPLIAAPPATQIHVAAATIALISGVIVVASRKGTPAHRIVGSVFAVAMMVAAAVSFAVTGLWPGHYSPIHLLSIVTLTTIPLAIWRRRVGDIRGHARVMGLNFAGLIGAGVFTLAPNRILGEAFGIAGLLHGF